MATTSLSNRIYSVGYPDEHIGDYPASSPEEAKRLCKEDMDEHQFTPDTPARERLKGLIAVPH